jgi:chemotaxis signal transduction protein
MNVKESGVGKAAELRQAFDQAFAEAHGSSVAPYEDFLAVRVGLGPYALRLVEISGFFAVKNITWVPSPVRELLGIVGVRRTLLPVYDLRALLGDVVDTTPRWLVVAAASPVGLAFDQLDGYLHLRRESMTPVAQADARTPYMREVVPASNPPRSIVDVASVLRGIENLVRHATPQKER